MALRAARAAVVARGLRGTDGFVRAASAALWFARSTSSLRPAPPTLLGMGEEALTRLARDMDQPAFRGKQIHDAIYGMRKSSVDDIKQLPESFRQQLVSAGLEVGRRAPMKVVSSPDGTRKVLIELHCGSIIEAVGIPQDSPEAREAVNEAEGVPLHEDDDEFESDETTTSDDGETCLEDVEGDDGWVRLGSELGARQREKSERADSKREKMEALNRETLASRGSARRARFTVCVSSQVGCAMRCSFCATGKRGFKRNLSAAEIVNQVLALEDVFGRRCTNVVMMGMGEPLMNLKQVLLAHRTLNEDLGIGGRRFTISTVGVPNTLSKLAAHALQATLAVSLHAPDQALREKLVPSASAYPIEALLEDCRLYKNSTGRRVTFEYTLLAGENDAPAQARALAKTLRSRVGRGCHVNLLPWNPVAGAEHLRPSNAAVRRFSDALGAERGITHTVRRTRGLEADAACGQLTGNFERATTSRRAA